MTVRKGQVRQFILIHDLHFVQRTLTPREFLLVLGLGSQKESNYLYKYYDVLIADEIYHLYDSSIEAATEIVCDLDGD